MYNISLLSERAIALGMVQTGRSFTWDLPRLLMQNKVDTTWCLLSFLYNFCFLLLPRVWSMFSQLGRMSFYWCCLVPQPTCCFFQVRWGPPCLLVVILCPCVTSSSMYGNCVQGIIQFEPNHTTII